MMIDTKKLEELISRSTEVAAEIKVCTTMGDFMTANMERCKADRNFCEWQAWIDALREIVAKMNTLAEEYHELDRQIKEMCQ